MPLPVAHPQLGSVGVLTSLPEFKVEVLCPRHLAAAVEAARLKAHPYEAPAYEFTQLWSPKA